MQEATTSISYANYSPPDVGVKGRQKEGFKGRNFGDQRADQQGGEPIRRRRILWETTQAWNGGVAE
ncbi:MAG: hypothetical protein A2Z11_04280 [Candidatus Woykebacteria bacterium RBG_16_43_9]|uniref:Uncharacterized protein n=1 Tax=Candidatus Woykebacteria bacterium RBG_16_43_9 TaxID=1802596 RepID=A0A1G1WG76_9BACT|nr:MAG: hypothetical protein A2Z11_04280 [Candidatus Woykebacteria bacterium RBG_16_43_9]